MGISFQDGSMSLPSHKRHLSEERSTPLSLKIPQIFIASNVNMW
jgi:hypothetical protein